MAVYKCSICGAIFDEEKEGKKPRYSERISLKALTSCDETIIIRTARHRASGPDEGLGPLTWE